MTDKQKNTTTVCSWGEHNACVDPDCACDCHEAKKNTVRLYAMTASGVLKPVAVGNSIEIGKIMKRYAGETGCREFKIYKDGSLFFEVNLPK